MATPSNEYTSKGSFSSSLFLLGSRSNHEAQNQNNRLGDGQDATTGNSLDICSDVFLFHRLPIVFFIRKIGGQYDLQYHTISRKVAAPILNIAWENGLLMLLLFCWMCTGRHRELKLLDVGTGNSNDIWEGNHDEDMDRMKQSSCCPACEEDSGVLLILPCSHNLCVHCVAAGEALGSGEPHRRHVSPPVCSLMCPDCQCAVELPCWDWSSATSCLPRHPTLSPTFVNTKTSSEEHHQQGDTHCCEVGDMTTQNGLNNSNAASTSVAPTDGDIDLREEEMEQSVFGLCFALDPLTIHPFLHLSKSSLTITYKGEGPPGLPPDYKVRRSMTFDSGGTLAIPQVCANIVIVRGQYYWEVDVCNSSVYRIGVISSNGSYGWWLERHGLAFRIVYDGIQEPLFTIPPQIKTLGVFLNIAGGLLSFHNPLNQEHLVTLPTRFDPAGVLPALGLGQGRLSLRSSLPPPPHVFLSKDSNYRESCGAVGGRWRKEITFLSVRKIVQKFEELAVSDSDSSFMSNFGSSCSALASLTDLRITGIFPSGQVERELEQNKSSI